MGRIIIHVDMDAFYASVEIRDNPSLKGKPVIIGALPDQRGVVSTCSYEARGFGVRSGMNIKEAYRLCPEGVYIHPDFEKYKAVSEQLHAIWDSYATVSEPIAFDESFLDVTATAGDFDRAAEMAHEIKEDQGGAGAHMFRGGGLLHVGRQDRQRGDETRRFLPDQDQGGVRGAHVREGGQGALFCGAEDR